MDTEEMPRVRELRVNAPVAVMPQDDGTIVLEIALPDGRPLRLLFTR
jgi:hypothetical protein